MNKSNKKETEQCDIPVMPRLFELVQVHEMNGYAEVVIRDKNNFYAYRGNLTKIDNPKSVYPPDYFNEA